MKSRTPWRESNSKMGAQDEYFWEYRVSDFRLQARRERNCDDRFFGTSSICGLGDRYCGAVSIADQGGWCLSTS
jgi:hypothetical protein